MKKSLLIVGLGILSINSSLLLAGDMDLKECQRELKAQKQSLEKSEERAQKELKKSEDQHAALLKKLDDHAAAMAKKETEWHLKTQQLEQSFEAFYANRLSENQKRISDLMALSERENITKQDLQREIQQIKQDQQRVETERVHAQEKMNRLESERVRLSTALRAEQDRVAKKEQELVDQNNTILEKAEKERISAKEIRQLKTNMTLLQSRADANKAFSNEFLLRNAELEGRLKRQASIKPQASMWTRFMSYFRAKRSTAEELN